LKPPLRSLATGLILLCAGPVGCTKFQLLNALVPPLGYTKTANVSFGPLPQQTLDVYQPTHPDAAHGVVVFLYGGDWQNGSKDDYAFAGQAFASRGFLTVVPNYRLWPAVQFPAFVEDAARAVRWTHDHAADFGGDPGHLYLTGHSAGAHIAALVTLDDHYLRDVGLERSAIRATAGLSGPYDFVPPPFDRPAFGMTTVDVHPRPDIEPIHFADGHAPPMLLVQGDQDTVVDPDNATHLAAAIRAAGGSVEVKRYPDRGHEGIVLSLAWPFRWLDPVLDDVADYFRRH
jgi:acetyl esterase/lipase